MLLKIFKKNRKGKKASNSFYEGSITLIPKPDKDTTEKELQAKISDEPRCKNPQQHIKKSNNKLKNHSS